MSASRMTFDRRPASSVTLRSMRRLAAATLALGLVAPVGAAPLVNTASAADAGAGAYAITLSPGTTTAEPTLTIEGTWATPCTPTFEGASLAGADLRIDARATLSLCARQPTPFRIEINPALALGRTPLPGGVLHISFYAADGAQGTPALRAFALVDTSPAAPAFAPESGFWWTTSGTRPSASRNVVSIERQGTQLTAALMSYDRDGRGSWQFGTAQLDGRIAHIPLLQLAGSDPFSAASTAPHGEAGLVLDVEFHGSALASAWLSRGAVDGALELQTMELVRLPFADAGNGGAWKGDWVLVSDAEDETPQRLHLQVAAPLDPFHFRLADAAAAILLDCALDLDNAELPPPRCVLRHADGSGFGSFSAVAINRMDGTRNDGVALHLLKVSP